MTVRKIIAISLMGIFGVFIAACSSNTSNNDKQKAEDPNSKPQTETPKESNDNPSYDPNRGTGKFTDVKVGDKLDEKLAVAGGKVSDVKCSSCHKLTDEKLVGPGWQGVTKRHQPAWIMNFITNTDEMLTKDPKAQAQLELCLVRMPNQSLSDDDARGLLEYMRKNDGVK
ncbi:MAG: c-type cytochrome [Bacteroidota bacterium]|nr:c-type cytochrome [Bacteroidota bacterium]